MIEYLWTSRGRTTWPARRRLTVLALAVLGLAVPSAALAAAQGFGATTPGGAGGAIVRVTNLNDDGPGSLRAAVAKGNRTVVFDVAGDIVLNDYLSVRGAFITIDGLTAPAPGITLRNRGLLIRGSRGAHDVIVRGIRVRNSPIDGIQIAYGAYNVVIDRVSVQGSGDGNLDITENAHDITVAWSIFAEPLSGKTMLIKYAPSRVSLHHNLFVRGLTRNPNASIDNASTPATDTTLDMRNNLVWDWSYGWGTNVHYGVRANVVANFYASPRSSKGDQRNALLVDRTTARVHTSGNRSGDLATLDLNTLGNEPTPFAAPPVDTEDACVAAGSVLANAGVRPLDAVDEQYLAKITLPPCASLTPTLAAVPDRLEFTVTAGGAAPPEKTVTLSDLAGNALAWTAAADGQGWLAAAAAGTTPGKLTVGVNPAGLAPGVFTGTVTLTAPAAANAPLQVPVTLTVTEPAAAGGGGATAGQRTLQLRVTDSADDGSEHATGVVRLQERTLKVGRSYIVGFRFAGVDIPRGARIAAATLRLYALGVPGSSIEIRYAGEAADDSAPFVGSVENLSARGSTTRFVDDRPAPWVANAYNPSPDLAAIVQEIVDRPGWAAGNALTIFVGDDGSAGARSIATVDRATDLATVLEIRLE
jgi:hypothetical protein